MRIKNYEKMSMVSKNRNKTEDQNRQISNFKKEAIDCVTLVYLFTLFRNNCSKQNSAYFLVFATREGFIIIINCCFPRQDDFRERAQGIQKMCAPLGNS